MPGSPTNFPGLGPLTINTSGSGSPGVVVNDDPAGAHGMVMQPPCVNGNNDVTAGNVAMADQAEQNTINWLLWRALDFIAGGDYADLFQAVVTIGNELCFRAGGGIVIGSGAGGALLKIGDGTHAGNMEVTSTASVTYDAGSTINGTQTVTASIKHSGNGAWEARRNTAITTAVTGFVAERYDTVWCYNSTGSGYTVALSDPNAAGIPPGVRVTFVAPSGNVQTLNASAVQINDHSGNRMIILGTTSGQFMSLTLETILVGGVVVWDRTAATLIGVW